MASRLLMPHRAPNTSMLILNQMRYFTIKPKSISVTPKPSLTNEMLKKILSQHYTAQKTSNEAKSSVKITDQPERDTERIQVHLNDQGELDADKLL